MKTKRKMNIKDAVSPESIQFFETIFGEDPEENKQKAQNIINKMGNQKPTSLILIEKFFEIMQILTSLVLPSAMILAITFHTVFFNMPLGMTLFSIFFKVMLPKCFPILLAALVSFIGIKLLYLIVSTVCIKFHYKSLVKHVKTLAFVQKKIEEKLKKEEKDKNRKPSTENSDLVDGYKPEDIVKHAKDLLQKDKERNDYMK